MVRIFAAQRENLSFLERTHDLHYRKLKILFKCCS